MFYVVRLLISTAVAVSFSAITYPANAQDRPCSTGAQTTSDDATELIAVLQSGAAIQEKAQACKRLAVVGGNDAIPVLAVLLSNEHLAHYARYGLETIPNPAVDDVFREALVRLKRNDNLLVGVVNSIGQRKDRKAVDGLTKLLANPKPAVAGAAAAALGRIGDSQAANVLGETLRDVPANLRPAIADACLACAENLLADDNPAEATALYDALRQTDIPNHLRGAATYGAILARKSAGIPLLMEQLSAEDDELFDVGLRATRQLPGADVTQALLGELSELPAPRKAMLLLALGERRDKTALPMIIQTTKAGEPEVRIAAIRGLRHLGDATVVPVLLDAAADPNADLAQTARASLVTLSGQDVDDAIVARLKQGGPKSRQTAMDVVGRRRIADAVPTLLAAADDSDEQIQVAAIKALGETIDFEQLSSLTGHITFPKNEEATAAAKEALKAACVRMPDRNLCVEKIVAIAEQAPTESQTYFLELLGTIGGSAALDAVSARARDPNEPLQDAATRVLGEWLSPDAAPELLQLAKTLSDNRFRIRALRGYIRIIRQLGLPADQRLAMCREAMDVAERDDERKLVLQVLGRVPSPESLALAVSCIDSPTLIEDASRIAVGIGEKIVQQDPDSVAQAMRQLREAGLDRELASRADRLLKQAGDKSGGQ